MRKPTMQMLDDLQKHWQENLLQNNLNAIAPAIVAPRRGSIEDRLAIYECGYMARLVDVLEKDYCYLRKYLGEEDFSILAKDYVAAYPSKYFSVRDVGQFLSQFIACYPRYKNQANYHAICEFAQFEWAIFDTIDAVDEPVLTKENLSTIPQDAWGFLHFGLHPSVKLLPMTSNAVAIYEAIIKEKSLPELETYSPPKHWRVWQQNLQVYYFGVSSPEAIFLEALQKNRAFGQICEQLCEQMPEDEVVNFAINQIIRWLNDGLLTSAVVRETA